MIRAFFEGPAGSGKTHQLIGEAIASADLLTGANKRLLALTFMNGSRQRLSARFAAVPQLRSRFDCLTFDSFAVSITQRRRSLLRALPAETSPTTLSDFDRACCDAARLLEFAVVADWIASTYPVVVVDEAQDLDAHRFRMLRAIAAVSNVIAAADEFQNLNEGLDAASVIAWLRGAAKPAQLARIRRTSKDGLLRVAGALREGRSIFSHLRPVASLTPCLAGPGVRIIEAPAKDGLLSWTIANELASLGARAVILTPSATATKVRSALDAVHSREFTRNKRTGAKFGPFPMAWERREDEEAELALASFRAEGEMPLAAVIDAITDAKPPEWRQICARLNRNRSVRGATSVTRDGLAETIRSVLRNAGRHKPRTAPGRIVMTIPRAKNREFSDVLVLWPHAVGGSVDHQRRLLYNALTRSVNRCVVVIFGQGRMQKPPFAE